MVESCFESDIKTSSCGTRASSVSVLGNSIIKSKVFMPGIRRPETGGCQAVKIIATVPNRKLQESGHLEGSPA